MSVNKDLEAANTTPGAAAGSIAASISASEDARSFVDHLTTSGRAAIQNGNRSFLLAIGLIFVHYALLQTPQPELTFLGLKTTVLRDIGLFLIPCAMAALHVQFVFCYDWENTIHRLLTAYYQHFLPGSKKSSLESLLLEPSLLNALRISTQSPSSFVRIISSIILYILILLAWIGVPVAIVYACWRNVSAIPGYNRILIFAIPLSIEIIAQFFLFKPSEVSSNSTIFIEERLSQGTLSKPIQ